MNQLALKQRTPSGPFYAHFTGPNGERLRLSTGTNDYGQAQIKALALMQEKLVDSIPIADRSKASVDMTTLASLLRDAYQAEWRLLKSAKSVRLRVTRIAREIGHWTIPQITRARLREWADGLTNGNRNDAAPVSAATKNRYMSCISRAMSYAKEESIPDLVMPKFPHWAENNIKERYLTDAEEARMMSWFGLADQFPWGRDQGYFRDLITLLLDTGMRAGEALTEFKRDSLIERDGVVVAIRLSHGSTKNGEGRMVPLTSRARDAALRMLERSEHGHMSVQQAGRRFTFMCDKLGIEGVTLHTLRHTCASRLVLSGESIYKVSRMLGHSSVKITERYANLMDGDLLDLAGALEARNTERRAGLVMR